MFRDITLYLTRIKLDIILYPRGIILCLRGWSHDTGGRGSKIMVSRAHHCHWFSLSGYLYIVGKCDKRSRMLSWNYSTWTMNMHGWRCHCRGGKTRCHMSSLHNFNGRSQHGSTSPRVPPCDEERLPALQKLQCGCRLDRTDAGNLDRNDGSETGVPWLQPLQLPLMMMMTMLAACGHRSLLNLMYHARFKPFH